MCVCVITFHFMAFACPFTDIPHFISLFLVSKHLQHPHPIPNIGIVPLPTVTDLSSHTCSPRSGMLGSCGSLRFNIFRDYQITFLNGLYAHWFVKILISPHLSCRLLSDLDYSHFGIVGEYLWLSLSFCVTLYILVNISQYLVLEIGG